MMPGKNFELAFDYQSLPLKQPDQQIRLFHLQPDDDGAVIQVRLEVHDFESCPSYVAISYTWGDQIPTLAITINGQGFRVRMNCWYALWQMRHHNRQSVFWIDCICIDQTNIAEKNHQVAKMGEIFSKAEMTASCLGPGDRLTAAKRFIRSSRNGNVQKADRDAVRELQHNSYFRRIWIKQEIILSKHVELFCGVDSLDWHAYEELLDDATAYDIQTTKTNSERHPKLKDSANSVHTSLVESRKQRLLFGHNSTPSSTPWAELWQLLATYGDAECQDPHDKIYALLSLMPEGLAPGLNLAVDYMLPLLDLSLQLVRNYIAELSVTSQPSSVSNQLPDNIWETLVHGLQHWFHPNMSDPIVSCFASQWSAASSVPMSNIRHSSPLEQPTRDPKYGSTLVYFRHTITGYLDEVSQDEYDRASNYDETYPVTGDRIAWMSNAILVKDIKEYLTSWKLDKKILKSKLVIDWESFGLPPDYRPPPDDEEIVESWTVPIDSFYTGSESAFTLSSLPPDLRVKIVVFGDTGQGYLVPAETRIGDRLLCCMFFDPRNTRVLLPIIRPYNHDGQHDIHASGGIRYSVLIGWAAQLGMDGSLLTSTDLVAREDADPFADLVFNVYYEDFVLYSILLQDMQSYLTQSCTHREHPSFLAEDLEDGANNTALLTGYWAEPSYRQIQMRSKEKEKSGKKGVSFAE
jgi:hypothetical protein